MSKSNVFENDLLQLIFNAVPISNIADNAGSAPLTELHVALHTADPGEAGNQATSECSYTGYSRIAVARTSGGWTVTGDSVSPNADIDFPEATAGSEIATHASIGVASSGSTKALYHGSIAPISIAPGVAPKLKQGSTITED